MKRLEYFEPILININILRYIIYSNVKLGRYDKNKIVEPFYCDILNKVFGWELERMDRINFPAIDLGCKKSRVGVQVTSRNDRKKIKDTLILFDNHCLDDYDRVLFFIITKKSNYRKKFNSKVDFRVDRDVMDVDDLLIEIEKLSIHKIKSISEFVRQEIPYYIGKSVREDDIFRHKVDYSSILPRNFTRFQHHFSNSGTEFEKFKNWCWNIHSKLLSLSKKARNGILVFLTKCDKSELKLEIQIWADVMESSFGFEKYEIIEYLKIIEDKNLLYNDESEHAFLNAYDGNYWDIILSEITETSELQDLIVNVNFSILD